MLYALSIIIYINVNGCMYPCLNVYQFSWTLFDWKSNKL